jgi:hypothetical protein
MKRAGLLRDLGFAEKEPPGWAMAWYEPQRRVKVCAPVGLHWLARWAREFWWRVGLALSAPERERNESQEMQRRIRESQRLAQEYARGYLAGWRECRVACVEAGAGVAELAAEADLAEELLDSTGLFVGAERITQGEPKAGNSRIELEG